MRKQNLAKDVYKDPKNAEMIRKLESLEIKDGKIILKVRAKAGDAQTESDHQEGVPVEIVPPKAEQPNGDSRRRTERRRPAPKPERSSRRHRSRRRLAIEPTSHERRGSP